MAVRGRRRYSRITNEILYKEMVTKGIDENYVRM
jgi:hypothetical protein